MTREVFRWGELPCGSRPLDNSPFCPFPHHIECVLFQPALHSFFVEL
jgi:hypothetical protein